MSLYRLSHSSLNLLNKCERFYQLERLLLGSTERQHYPATVLGTAYGAGVASYLVHQDQDKALYDLWLAYFPILEDAVRTEAVAANLLIASIPELDNLLQDWEVLTFNSKPAVELSFSLQIDPKFYYVGYVDVVLKNKWTGRVAVMDVKTTALKLLDLSPLYQNSDQCLSYSIVLDKVVGEANADYDVLYFVGQLGSGNGFSPIIKPYSFSKSLHDRLDWFISLGLDVKHITEMMELGIFPKRGDACLQYNRPCKHFGTCQLHGFDRMPEEVEEDTKEYQFTFELEALIQDHIDRINAT